MKLVIAQMKHETNTYSPVPTPIARFSSQGPLPPEGDAAIRAGFENIFATGGIPVIPEQVHRLHTMTAAVHHLAERITITSAEGTQTAWVLATNVFLKTEQGWRLVVHHASPGSVGEPPPVMGEPPSLLH